MSGMSHDPHRDPRRTIQIDPGRTGGITGDPQEIAEQPDLSFERLRGSRWLGRLVLRTTG
jgi:hypothetical protein